MHIHTAGLLSTVRGGAGQPGLENTQAGGGEERLIQSQRSGAHVSPNSYLLSDGSAPSIPQVSRWDKKHKVSLSTAPSSCA